MAKIGLKNVKIGDLVRLKSGGPVMTVNAASDQNEGTVDTIWFSKNNDQVTCIGQFCSKVLELISEKQAKIDETLNSGE
jgi:uncharacterized protein YodC (DUF2158 family)